MRKCDITRYKNKKWTKLYINGELEEFIYEFYINKNNSFNDLKVELQCSEGKLIKLLKEFNISKPKNLICEKVVETRLRNGNGVYETAEIRSKKQATCLAKYGVENYMDSDDFKSKRKNTMISKYGAEYTMQSNELKAKVENTNLLKYGYKNAFQDNIWQKVNGGSKLSWSQSARNTRQLNYEKNGFYKSKWSEKTFNILKNKNNFCDYLSYLPTENRTIAFISNDLGVIYDDIRNRYIKWNLYNEFPLQQFRSTPEIELTNYIKSIYSGNILINTRRIITPYELDLYLPELHLAIEYNGEFWHKNKLNIDSKKELLCKNNNIKLYTIKESDYIKNKDEVYNKIKILIEGGENRVNKYN